MSHEQDNYDEKLPTPLYKRHGTPLFLKIAWLILFLWILFYTLRYILTDLGKWLR